MRTTSLILLLAIITAYTTNAQSSFQKLVKGDGRTDLNQVSKASDGFIHAGRIAEDSNIVVTKFDDNANIQWMHFFSGKTSASYGTCKILQGTDGGYIVLTYTPFVVFKLNMLGNIVWSKKIDFEKSSGYTINNSTDMIFSNDGALVMTGFMSNGFSFILKMNYSDGSIDWAKKSSLRDSIGTATYIWGVQQSFNGNYIVCGFSAVSRAKKFLAEFDTGGNLLWSNVYKSTSYFPSTVITTLDKKYLSAGLYSVVKSDSTGNILWVKNLSVNLPHSSYVSINQVIQNPDSSFTLAGYYVYHLYHNYDTKALVVKMDKAGNVIEARSVGEGDKNKPTKFFNVINTNDGGFLTSGDYFTDGAKRYLFLAKFDNNGNTCSQDIPDVIASAALYQHETRALVAVDISSLLTVENYSLMRDVGHKFITTICSAASSEIAVASEDRMQKELQTTPKPSITIYPNPSKGTFVFTLPQTLTGNVAVRVVSMTGQTVYNEQLRSVIQNSTYTISLGNNVTNGMYTLIISSAKQEIRKQFTVLH